MLFISRPAGINKWGVTDTDDGTETIVTTSLLEKYINLGVDVKGVTMRQAREGYRRKYVIDKVEVYRGNLDANKDSAKARILRGIDIVVRNDTILSVNWNTSILRPNTRIRLSDYASKCENFIFVNAGWPGVKVTVVIDDKIKIKSATLNNFYLLNVSIDVTEVTNQKTLDYIYDSYTISFRGLAIRMGEYIIDAPERLKAYQCVSALYNGNMVWYNDVSAEANAIAAKRALPEFKHLATMPLKLSDPGGERGYTQPYCKQILKHRAFWEAESAGYEAVRNTDTMYIDGILGCVRDCFCCNYYKQSLMIYYMEFFEPTPQIQELYVKICYRVAKHIIEMAKFYRWA